jgi:hypothetical protein
VQTLSLETNQSWTVAARRLCTSCGARFNPASNHHQQCWKCRPRPRDLVCHLCLRPFQHDRFKKYCSQDCLAQAQCTRPIQIRTCGFCRQLFEMPPRDSDGLFCSKPCYHKAQHARSLERQQRIQAERATRPTGFTARLCLICGVSFMGRGGARLCSDPCRQQRAIDIKVRHRKGKQPARTQTCLRCGASFQTRKQTSMRCHRCVKNVARAAARKRNPHSDRRGRHEYRAKHAGVPYVYGINPSKVFERDRWRCHLCGCKTPPSLIGKNQAKSPELDHIIPMACGGGHTWDNVACACHKCNGRKSARILGQMRLSFDGGG